MPISLYDVSVGTHLQILPAIAAMIDKAEAHCAANNVEPGTICGTRLAPDMWPFAKQIFECAHHSARAIEGIRAGVFGPELDPAPENFGRLKQEIADARAMLEGVDRAEIDGMAGRDMRFEFGTMRMDFTVEDFLLSFSLPNFYFHATTAYDVLRSQGVPLGKRDFMGRPRLKS